MGKMVQTPKNGTKLQMIFKKRLHYYHLQPKLWISIYVYFSFLIF